VSRTGRQPNNNNNNKPETKNSGRTKQESREQFNNRSQIPNSSLKKKTMKVHANSEQRNKQVEARRKEREDLKKLVQAEVEQVEQSKSKKGMRTAIDVCKRINWDPVLRELRNQFTIGYLDRFDGVVDSPFTEFNFEEIPFHRIQNFKYRDVVVWDKNTRVDHFFGSRSTSHLTIYNLVPVA